MKFLNNSFLSRNLTEKLLRILRFVFFVSILVFISALLLGIEKPLVAQISTQKVSPVKPAEQPKQFQTQPKPQFQLSPSIKVIYPNGGEIWEKGKTYTIRWTSQNVQGNVQIQLLWSMTGPGGLHTISNVPNTGSYNFTVPKLSDLAEITPYLLISSMDGKAKDYSDKFFTIRQFFDELYNEYLGEHPHMREIDWGQDAQGIAHDAHHWYITQTMTLWKIPVSIDLSNAGRRTSGVKFIDLQNIPQLYGQGYNHFGDLDYYEYRGQGYLLIPLDGEGWGDRISSVKVIPPPGGVSHHDHPVLYEHAYFQGWSLELRESEQHLSWYNDEASSIWIPNGWTVEMYEHPEFKGALLRKTAPVNNLHLEIKKPAVIAAFDAATLRYIDHTTLGIPAAPWCAIDSQGIMYMSMSDTPVLRFKVHWETLHRDRKLKLEPLRPFHLQDEAGKPVFIDTPQGGAVSPSGNLLYLVAGYYKDSHPSWGLHIFDLRTGKRIERSINTSGVGGFKYEFHPGILTGQEPEGMTIWDLDDGHAPGITGKLHVLMLNNDADHDDICLKHYTTSTHKRGKGGGTGGDSGREPSTPATTKKLK